MTGLLATTLALAAAQPVAEAPPEAMPENEIEVIGNRLRDWKGSWKLSKGKAVCKTRSSTGDKAIDAIGCDAIVQCIAPLAPRFAAIEDARLSKAEALQQVEAMLETARFGDCVSERRQAGIASLAAARRSQRS